MSVITAEIREEANPNGTLYSVVYFRDGEAFTVCPVKDQAEAERIVTQINHPEIVLIEYNDPLRPSRIPSHVPFWK